MNKATDTRGVRAPSVGDAVLAQNWRRRVPFRGWTAGWLAVPGRTWLLPLVVAAMVMAMGTAPVAAQGRSGSGLDWLNQSSLPQGPGVMVVEDLLDPPLELELAEDAVVFSEATFERRVGLIRRGTRVRVAALTGEAVRVRGRATHADVAGWLKMEQLRAPDPDLFDNLKAMYERYRLVADLIEKNQVALGMTVDEVRASLGAPTRKSSELTAEGRRDVLEYAVFERVPQVQTVRGADGRLYNSTVFIRVQTGSLTISFEDDQVVSIAEEEGNPLPDSGVRIVPPPVILF